jgi:hypothetical protein
MQRFQLVLGARGRSTLAMVGLVAAGAACGGSGTTPPPVTSSGAPTTGSSGGTAGGTTGGTTSGGTTSGTPATGGAVTSTSGSGMSSGSASSGYPAQTGVCAGAGTRVLTNTPSDAFVDDFEEATGLSAGWSAFNDVTPTENSFMLVLATPGAVGTAHSGHYAGVGAKTSTMGGFGVGLIYNTAIDPAAGVYCIDISAFDGVSFWAKSATAGSTISLNFVLPSTNATSMDSMGRPNGGDCVPNATNSNCYNHPRVTVTLTAGWAQYAVQFSQAGGGSAKVANVVQELGWLSPDANWDFSLDEIAFYKGTPPSGPVGTGATTVGPINSDAGSGDAGSVVGQTGEGGD